MEISQTPKPGLTLYSQMLMDNTDVFIKVAFQGTAVCLGPEPLPESKGKSCDQSWDELLAQTIKTNKSMKQLFEVFCTCSVL